MGLLKRNARFLNAPALHTPAELAIIALSLAIGKMLPFDCLASPSLRAA
jgi:hypothetical protein